MRVLGIIPARYGSTRFPGKPLALIHGKPMIQRVYERAVSATCLDKVVVATDDERISKVVSSFGGRFVMTSASHESGTDRCAEVLSKKPESFDVIINIQGDEPYISTDQIEQVADCFKDPKTELATLVKRISDKQELFNKNIPKVVTDDNGWALYFSRNLVPFCKEEEIEQYISHGLFLKHIGIYGYRAEVLPHLTMLSRPPIEKAESLEQLRWLHHGYRIRTAVTSSENLAVDVPGDIARLEAVFKNGN
jgi:3-deoxy-manno-octulosonate cytidylyltransferase (CMP-KDO synthetase)